MIFLFDLMWGSHTFETGFSRLGWPRVKNLGLVPEPGELGFKVGPSLFGVQMSAFDSNQKR